MPEEYFEIPDALLNEIRENIINCPGATEINIAEIGGPEPGPKRYQPIGGPEPRQPIVIGKPKGGSTIIIKTRGPEEEGALWRKLLATHSCPHCHKPIIISLGAE